MEGQINSSLWYLNDHVCGAVLPLIDDVMKQLHDKHPKAQPAKLGSLLFGPVEEMHESAYNEITSEVIREVALRTTSWYEPLINALLWSLSSPSNMFFRVIQKPAGIIEQKRQNRKKKEKETSYKRP